MSNRISSLLKSITTNKVIGYTITRYAVYGIQFFVSMLCAAKMGPYYYGIWGFIMMILSYMQRIDLGIPNAMNIILVQEKDNKMEFSRVQTSGFLLIAILCVCIILFALGNVVWGYGFMEKYPIGSLFYVVCIIAVISYYVSACTGIYRVKHNLLEIAISQSITPLLLLIALFIADGQGLLLWFTIAYLIGNLVSLMLFLFRKKIDLNVRPSRKMADRIVVKGFYLFLYNACFYFIMISTRTIVSSNYSVEQFGYFTFAFSLADAVILLLGAFTFLMFPKVIYKLNSTDIQQVKNTIKQLRNNYISLVHVMMYLAFLLFPVLVLIFPKYEPALPALYMVGIALIMETNACGYVDYLMAQNKDRQIATISGVALAANIIFAIVMVKLFHCTFAFVMVATLISYWLFSFLCVFYGLRKMGEKFTILTVLNESMPIRLLVPYASTSLFFLVPQIWVLPIPLILFFVFNISIIKELYNTFCHLLINPNMLDVDGV